jgi:hypothetical protein
MKLIVEELEGVSFKRDKTFHYIVGPFIQSGIVNGNKRRYLYENVKGPIDLYIKDKVKKNRALGEFNHPPTPEIDPKKTSHVITELHEEMLNEAKGICNWNGKARVLNTPDGLIVQALLEGGVQLAVSTRALGSLKSINGINEVQNDFRLCTAADIVYEPSAPDAFVYGILENKEWVVDGQGLLREMFVEDYKKEIQKQSAKKTKDELLIQFRHFLSII